MADLRMPEVNSVVLTGNLTRDPVLRQNPNGGMVVSFTVATNKRYRRYNDELKEEVSFISVVARRKLAESCSRYLKKGSAVLIEGELQSRIWKIGEDNSHTVVEVRARRIQFLKKREKLDNEESEKTDS